MGKNVAWSLFQPIFNKMGFITMKNVEKERLYLQRMKRSTCMHRCFSHVLLSVTVWTLARQAPLSVGFSRQEFPYNKFESGETIAPPSSPFAFILIFVFFSNKFLPCLFFSYSLIITPGTTCSNGNNFFRNDSELFC